MANVRLILREDVPKLGHAGDVVTVKPGYARNYLVPQGLAIHATAGRLAELDHHPRVSAEKVARETGAQEALRDRVQSVSLAVEMQAGAEGRLFGSVTATRIAELLSEQGVDVDRRRIDLDQPIKEVGEHTVAIRLHREVTAEVKLVVTGAGMPEGPPEADEEAPEEPSEDTPDEPAADDAPPDVV